MEAISIAFHLLDCQPPFTSFQTATLPVNLCQADFDDDDLHENEDRDTPFNPSYWDDADEDDQFDPESGDDEVYNDLDLEVDPDSSEEIPPDELWNDADWE